MRKNLEFVLLGAAALALAGCGDGQMERFRQERAEKKYQAAIADYTAGRLDAAEAGFRAVVRDNPSNASAQFNLAVLLQDSRRDYLEAICHYRAYEILAPESDKAALARERAKACEPLLAKQLAERLNYTDNSEVTADRDAARAALKAAEAENAALRKELESVRRELDTAKKESEGRAKMLSRLGGFAASDDGDDPGRGPTARTVPADATDGAEGAPRKVDVVPVVPADDEGPVRLNPEAVALNDEAEAEERAEILPTQTEENRSAVRLTDIARQEGRREPEDPMASLRPKTYVVQPGDTLTSIARRFYGKKSAWKRIQEANKATVPIDGSVKAGQELSLP